MNLPESTSVFTLDLDRNSADHTAKLENADDLELADLQFEHESELAFLGTPYEPRITRLYGDSNKFDFTDFRGKMDMVYVDGGRTLETRKCDSENAFKLLPADSSGCIAWHDYGNRRFSELANYLNDLSSELPLYHVEETMVCFFLQNISESLKTKLTSRLVDE